MAHYRKIDSRIWNDEKFTALSERAKLCFLFLLTHPNLTMVGAMRATITGLASELFASHKKNSAGVLEGFGEALLEGYIDAFREAITKGLVKYDDKACLLWLPNFLKYNSPESPNVIKSWPKAYDLLPECAMKHSVYGRMKAYAQGLTEGFSKAFSEAFGEPMPKTMPNQEQEQEQYKDKRHTASQYVFPEQTDPKDKILILLPTSNGKTFPITTAYVEELRKAYPALNLPEQFEQMRIWLDANPKKRKKPTGIKRFVVGWLNRKKAEIPTKSKTAAAATGKNLVGDRKAQGDGSFKL